MSEGCLLTGALEETSELYSLAKIAGIKLCQAFKKQYGFNAVVMVPATDYGPGSDVNTESAHVIGALIGKFTNAVIKDQRQVSVWGTGKPRREFLYVDDFIKASLHLMDNYDGDNIVNAGAGRDISIKELAELIGKIVGFQGEIVFDETKPDGTQQKLLDSSFAETLGWKAQVSLKEGIKRTYEWY